ncbi:MAG: alpha/beta hydrolase [Bacteroidales bacterium]|nr:alpha/beta hydrolase [Bacteroidales bacterium]
MICLSLSSPARNEAGSAKQVLPADYGIDGSNHVSSAEYGIDSSLQVSQAEYMIDGPLQVSQAEYVIDSPLQGSPAKFWIGGTRMELRDTARGSRRVTFEAWYPVPGEGQPVSEVKEQKEKFPVICFAHGYQHPGDRYGNLVEMLVPEGYIMLALTTFEGIFPSHWGYAEEIRFLADVVATMGRDTLSPLYGIADTVICLMGHSMGGGASFHAAADNPAVDAIITLAPYDTRPSAIEAAGRVRVPTLIISGTADCITPPEKYHLPMYERSEAEDKTYISIIDGSHCGMGALRKCFTAEKLAGCKGGLGTEEQTAILSRYIIPWLDCLLKGEKEQGAVFNRTLASDTAVTWLRSRPLPEPD